MIEVPAHIVETYALANTPAFLLKRLRADPFVQRLAREPLSSTVGHLREMLPAAGEQQPARVAGAYALLVALLVRGDQEARAAAAALPIGRLDWGRTIYELVNTSMIPSEFIALQAPHVVHQFAAGSTNVIRSSVGSPLTFVTKGAT